MTTQQEYRESIEKIEIAKEKIAEDYLWNRRVADDSLANQKKYRLIPQDDRTAKIKTGRDPREDGGYYPDDPHPIWISPSRFIDEDKMDFIPTKTEEKEEMRKQGIDPEENKEKLEEWLSEAEKIWKEDLEMKDEIKIPGPQDIMDEDERHTIKVIYMED